MGFDLHASNGPGASLDRAGQALAPAIRVIADVGIGDLDVARGRDVLAGTLGP